MEDFLVPSVFRFFAECVIYLGVCVAGFGLPFGCLWVDVCLLDCFWFGCLFLVFILRWVSVCGFAS